jgi:hypothetical protein
MRRKVAGLIVAAVLLAVPTGVSASAFSAWTYNFRLTPAGYSLTNLCQKAGIVDVASNNGQVKAWVSAGFQCSGTSQALPSGWLGMNVKGYRDGLYCGQSGYVYTTSATSFMSHSAVLCSNPSGTQSFTTTVYGVMYDGGGYWGGSTTTSPAQNY